MEAELKSKTLQSEVDGLKSQIDDLKLQLGAAKKQNGTPESEKITLLKADNERTEQLLKARCQKLEADREKNLRKMGQG